MMLEYHFGHSLSGSNFQLEERIINCLSQSENQDLRISQQQAAMFIEFLNQNSREKDFETTRIFLNCVFQRAFAFCNLDQTFLIHSWVTNDKYCLHKRKHGKYWDHHIKHFPIQINRHPGGNYLKFIIEISLKWSIEWLYYTERKT